ncbi:MAG TPA: 16S rRNA (uracil(1498)-N(3))-methyltransferase [Gammaproteobacteria bacterium]|nr:16S rRNA (uracil(1498)-N(3))-methyltransferase [Gammaproteobacteria bacterium]
MPRQYIPQKLNIGNTYLIENEQHHHLLHVLRKKLNDPITLFNNHGGEYLGTITHISKTTTSVIIEKHLPINRSSNLSIHLGQVISRKSAMTYSLEKACELGVTEITPLLNSNTPKHRSNLTSQWQKTIIQACMQCGLNQLPILNPSTSVPEWIKSVKTETRLVLSPHHASQFSSQRLPQSIALLIGAEEGLNEETFQLALEHSFLPWNLGTRTLRTETATTTSLSILQYLWGDINHIKRIN